MQSLSINCHFGFLHPNCHVLSAQEFAIHPKIINYLLSMYKNAFYLYLNRDKKSKRADINSYPA